jgi:hypothetical protein
VASNRRSADVLPFGQPRDFPIGVRFIPPEELARLTGDHDAGYQHYDESEGLHEFFGDISTWLNGFCFGGIAGALVTVWLAYLWSFFL